MQGDEGVEIGVDAELDWVTRLLDLDKQWLNEALTMKVTVCICLIRMYNIVNYNSVIKLYILSGSKKGEAFDTTFNRPST